MLENKTTDPENKTQCSSCGASFTCNSQNISQCDCKKISLTSEEKFYIASRFSDCLCNSCLIQLKTEALQSNNSDSSKKGAGKIIALCVLILFYFTSILHSQTYAPPVGQAGCTAIYKDSSVFVNWVKSCSVSRGYQDISNTSLGLTSVGDESMVKGKAQTNGVLSLGDGGSVICEFNYPIRNEAGFDFAVFENSIDDSFLELAFVEVSSDGLHFFRFKSHSLTDTLNQTGSFGSTDATKINNLAGKYRAGYGTPFDLQELAGINGLDINSITHIKIVDVIGVMNNLYASRDGFNNKVNDPWPTPFPSGGFDLDAIGVIHENRITSLEERSLASTILVYPNPLSLGGALHIDGYGDSCAIECMDVSGQIQFVSNGGLIKTDTLQTGVYIFKIICDKGFTFKKIVIQ